jgi:predicted nucleic acid-binding protein
MRTRQAKRSERDADRAANRGHLAQLGPRCIRIARFTSMTLGVKMGKNDLWIAATTLVIGGALLTTDSDFDHLLPHVLVERVVPEQLRSPDPPT